MSYFAFGCTVPITATKEAPYEKELPLTDGVIHIVRIYIPPGSKGLVHGTIRKGLHQIWPTEPSEDFHGDDREPTWKEEYELHGPPYSLTFRGWNDDDTFNHEMVVEFGVLPYDVLHPEVKMIESIEKLVEWLGV